MGKKQSKYVLPTQRQSVRGTTQVGVQQPTPSGSKVSQPTSVGGTMVTPQQTQVRLQQSTPSSSKASQQTSVDGITMTPQQTQVRVQQPTPSGSKVSQPTSVGGTMVTPQQTQVRLQQSTPYSSKASQQTSVDGITMTPQQTQVVVQQPTSSGSKVSQQTSVGGTMVTPQQTQVGVQQPTPSGSNVSQQTSVGGTTVTPQQTQVGVQQPTPSGSKVSQQTSVGGTTVTPQQTQVLVQQPTPSGSKVSQQTSVGGTTVTPQQTQVGVQQPTPSGSKVSQQTSVGGTTVTPQQTQVGVQQPTPSGSKVSQQTSVGGTTVTPQQTQVLVQQPTPSGSKVSQQTSVGGTTVMPQQTQVVVQQPILSGSKVSQQTTPNPCTSTLQLTPSDDRYWRLVKIILEDVPSKLRQLFRSAFQSRYRIAWGDNSMSGKFFMGNVPKSKKRDKHIVDTVEQGSTANFDCTTLFYSLLFSGTDLLLPVMRKKELRVSPFYESERVDQLQYNRLQQEIDVEKARIDSHEQRLQNHEQRLQDLQQGHQDLDKRVQDIEQQSQPQQDRETFVKTVEEKVKTALRKTYTDYTVPVQWSVNADSCRNISLDDMFVELRIQHFQRTKLPETLGYRDVVKMREIMQSAEPIQTSQLFDKLYDRHAPRNVLILGKAGIGKTTLVKQIAKQWAEKTLWNDDVEYLFVVTLRELWQERKLTLGDILLGGLGLTEEEKSEALKQLCKNSHRTMVVLEAMDEASYFKYEKKLQRDCTMEVDVNTLLSGIIDDTMLPGAKVIITSRPNDNIPTAMCHRTADLYGFPQESIKMYIHKFSREDTAVEKFITGYLQNNMNIATLCYVPVQANFVCACLANMYSSTQSEDTPSVNTMSQLYVFAAINLARTLHPSLKHVKEQTDSKKIFAKVGNSFKKHAELAKYCTMSRPLRIIIYEDDLDEYHISNTDRHTGFLAESTTRDLIPSGLKRRCWIYQHLTIQEMFTAVGLLRGPPEDLLKLIDDETFLSRHDVLITFITGLLCDPQIAYFMRCLEPAKDQLKPRTFIEKLVCVFDTRKLTTYIYESQLSELIDLVPEEIEVSEVFPTEMLSICWIVKQQQCGVVKLTLKDLHLDIHLFKQLCDALEQNRSIQELKLISCGLAPQGLTTVSAGLTLQGQQLEYLNLSYNRGLLKTVEAAEVLGCALAAMTRLCRLELRRCDLSPQALTAVMAGLTCGGHQLQYLDLSSNEGLLETVEATETLGRALAAMTHLCRLELDRCDLSPQPMTAILAGLTRGGLQLEYLGLIAVRLQGPVQDGRAPCKSLNTRLIEIRHRGEDFLAGLVSILHKSSCLFCFSPTARLWECGLTDQSLNVVSTRLTNHGGQQLERINCGGNPLTDACRDTFRDLFLRCPNLRIWARYCRLSRECCRQLREEFGEKRFISHDIDESLMLTSQLKTTRPIVFEMSITEIRKAAFDLEVPI
ncbi:hypothetical protein LSAT2_004897 [Lamellibrachia satsuma]|nr:hypothetical protein LSAT2_004897 [Lamellibrachia satsuma]